MLCAKVPRWPRGTSRRGTAYRTFKHGKMLVQRTCFLSTLARCSPRQWVVAVGSEAHAQT
eukprot:scaffold316593_cov23-Tisochrysis_lutea.AAC.1